MDVKCRVLSCLLSEPPQLELANVLARPDKTVPASRLIGPVTYGASPACPNNFMGVPCEKLLDHTNPIRALACIGFHALATLDAQSIKLRVFFSQRLSDHVIHIALHVLVNHISCIF